MEKKNLIKKGIVLVILFLFVGTSVISTLGVTTNVNNHLSESSVGEDLLLNNCSNRFFLSFSKDNGCPGDDFEFAVMAENIITLSGLGFYGIFDPSVFEFTGFYWPIPALFPIGIADYNNTYGVFGAANMFIICDPGLPSGVHRIINFTVHIKESAVPGKHSIVLTDGVMTDCAGRDHDVDLEYGVFTVLNCENMPPIISNPHPVDGAVDVPVDLSELCVDIFDPDGDFFDWCIGDCCYYGELDGTKCCPISDLDYNTKYVWNVTAVDFGGSGKTVEKIFTFTTELKPNNPPVIECLDLPDPVLINFTEICIDITDPDGDCFNWTVETIPYIGSGNSQYDNNGTKCISISGLEYSTLYSVHVTATDIHGATSEKECSFETEYEPDSELEIDMYYGNVVIRNIGQVEARNVSWNVDITGGIFGLIDKHLSGTEEVLPIGSKITTKLPTILGLGSFTIAATAKADNAEKVTGEKNGFVFLYFIIEFPS